MDWDRKTLSPNELNKYSYCPYQWYYERLYGRKELNRMRQERNKALSLEDATVSHLARGEKHHTYLYGKMKWRNFFGKACLFLLIAGIVGICLYYGVLQ